MMTRRMIAPHAAGEFTRKCNKDRAAAHACLSSHKICPQVVQVAVGGRPRDLIALEIVLLSSTLAERGQPMGAQYYPSYSSQDHSEQLLSETLRHVHAPRAVHKIIYILKTIEIITANPRKSLGH